MWDQTKQTCKQSAVKGPGMIMLMNPTKITLLGIAKNVELLLLEEIFDKLP